MDTITEILFEDPTIVYALLLVAMAVVVGLWFAHRSRKLLVAMLIPPLLAIGAYTLERFVVTDREQILGVLREFEAATEEGRIVEAVDSHVAPDMQVTYEGKRLNRWQALTVLKGIVKIRQPDGLAFYDEVIEVDGDRAKSSFGSNITYDENRKVPIQWRVTWIRIDDAWKVLEVDEPQFSFSTGPREVQ